MTARIGDHDMRSHGDSEVFVSPCDSVNPIANVNAGGTAADEGNGIQTRGDFEDMITSDHELTEFNKDTNEAEVQVNPNHSGLPPKSKTYFWNEQLPNLVQEDFYAEQVEARIKDLDFRANNIRREINAQTESRVDEANRMEMESERLKGILEESKKND